MVTIKKKMIGGLGIILIVMIATNVYLLSELLSIARTSKVTITEHVRAIDLAKELQTALTEEERSAQKLVISQDQAYADLLRGAEAQFASAMDSLAALQESPEGLIPLQLSHRRLAAAMDSLRVDMLLKRSAGQPAATASAGAMLPTDSIEAMRDRIDDIILASQKIVDESIRSVELSTRRSYRVASMITVGSVLLALFLAFFIPWTITKPIDILIRGTEQIARGVFDPISVRSHDETRRLAEAINAMSAALKEIHDIRTELLQFITHEMRTPLQSILAALYLIRRPSFGTAEFSEDQKEMLDAIKNNVDKLSQFINQMLDLAKVESGKMDYHFEPLDLGAVVTPVVLDQRLIASRKDIILSFDVQHTPAMMGDEEKLAQVVTNLITNSIKYTEPGGIIAVLLYPQGQWIVLKISDNGAGIPPEALPNLFTKFYQAPNLARNTWKGTGLGLAIVKVYTDGHGGTVAVESTVGKGTTFELKFPAISARDQLHPRDAELSDPALPVGRN